MKVSTDSKKIEQLLTRGVDEVIERKHLEGRLKKGDLLRIKFGIDPTGPVLHLGHSVPLRLLRRFQELGHCVIFLVGDFTAKIGDPTGRVESRPPLTDEQIKENMKTYLDQAEKILNMKQVEVRYNSEWYSKMSAADLYQLTSLVTYGQVVAREDFKKRISADQDFTFSEFLYPIFQGYDSVALKSDVEIGGTDQTFNMLMGRRILRRYGFPEQDVITVPLLEGLDGTKKMSKSAGNYIGLTEPASEVYGKIMSLPDVLIVRYFELCTDVSVKEIEEMKKELKKGMNPRDLKAKLARTLVAMYHNASAAESAEEQFLKLFREHEAPEEIEEIKVKNEKWNIVDLLMEVKLASSRSDARRLIEQKGIKIDMQPVVGMDTEVTVTKKGIIIQRGKRQFVKVKFEVKS